jgi:TRAP-type C4-dicarboxylate transport system substrate-binding protein
MKIKTEGGDLEYHSSVGMQGVQVSATETYMALKLGTVDAADWDVSAVTGLKWNEVAPYWIKGMECDHALGHILVSLRKWNALPDNLKAAMHKAAEDYWYATVDTYEKEMEAVDKLVQEGKVIVNVLDQDCQQKYADVAHKMWKEYAKQDEASAKAIKLIKEWRGVK